MNLPNVPPAITGARHDDYVVQVLQQYLAANLTWLERCYHIARVGVDSLDKYTYPQIQDNVNKGDCFNIRPDNKVKSYCFFEVENPYELNYYEGEATYNLSVVFWGNLRLIDNTKTYDYTSHLIKQVTELLEKKMVDSLTVEENPERIFSKYSGLKQETNQYLMRKYTAFKITFSLTTGITNNC